MILTTLIVLNAILTHGNNAFRMQVAVGMDLQAYYCDDTVQALREANCLLITSDGVVQVKGNSLECRSLLEEEQKCQEEYQEHGL